LYILKFTIPTKQSLRDRDKGPKKFEKSKREDTQKSSKTKIVSNNSLP